MADNVSQNTSDSQHDIALEKHITAPERATMSFLSLPAEVRNRIYEWSLCPTAVIRQIRSQTSRLATSPVLIPQLLATCRTVYNECGRDRSYLFENEICLSIDAHETFWPVIAETRLPQHVLARIESMCIIFDCTGIFRASYEDVDFTALTALTSLRKLRIAVMFDDGNGYHDGFCVAMLEQVLSRIPKEVEITCRISEEDAEQHMFLRQMVQRRKEGRKMADAVKVMDCERLQAAVDGVEDGMRGAKNGGVSDVFAEYRPGTMRTT